VPRPQYLLATRNTHKVREISKLLAGLDVEVQSLSEAGIPYIPGEDEVEIYGTFEENALAKARFYRRHTHMAVIADDSGLCVDSLRGAPGVRSRRFAADHSMQGSDEDRANNECLLRELSGVPDRERGAHYRCALAVLGARRSLLLAGRLDGFIAREPSGGEGFGYDPVFFVPEYGKTVGDLAPEVKADISHRAAAIRSLRRWIQTTHSREESL
jgi:XTP/dITP diphosphohydrolase